MKILTLKKWFPKFDYSEKINPKKEKIKITQIKKIRHRNLINKTIKSKTNKNIEKIMII